MVARELNIEIIRGFSEESSFIIRASMLYNVRIGFIKITLHLDLKCYYFVLV